MSFDEPVLNGGACDERVMIASLVFAAVCSSAAGPRLHVARDGAVAGAGADDSVLASGAVLGQRQRRVQQLPERRLGQRLRHKSS